MSVEKTCETCHHLEEDENMSDYYFCNIHRKEIFDPTRAGCHHRDKKTLPRIDIRDYVGPWFDKRGHQYK